MSASPADRRVVASACPLDCPDACSIDVTVEDGRVARIDGNHVNPFTAGFVCGKVRDYARHVYHETRLARPLARKGPKGRADFEPVSWDVALERVCERIRAARDRHGPESILPFAYGGSNGCLTHGGVDERLFRRLGASRLARTVCAAPTTLAARGLYGSMPGVAFEDYVHARLIVVWGANPSASGIHLVPILDRARAAGAELVVVDPRRTPLARRADLHVPLMPGTDLPVALSIVRWLFETGRADEAFLERCATGVETLRERARPWTFERAARAADVDPGLLAELARRYADASPAVIRCGWGLERNRNGGSAVAAVLALPAVAGKLGVRGGGYTLSNSAAWKPGDAVGEPEPTTRVVNMNLLGRYLLGAPDPPVDVLFVYDANPVTTLPEQNKVRAGLEREDLFTVVFDQVMTDTARYADVVLPATTFLEHADLRHGYGALVLQESRPVIEPVGEARPNYAVFAELIERLGLARPGDPVGVENLRDALLLGSSRMRAELDGARIARPDCGARPVQMRDVLPGTGDGRIHLAPDEHDRAVPGGLYAYEPDPATPELPLALVSPATSRTVSSHLGELHAGPASLAMHPADAAARGIPDGAPIRVFNASGEVHTRARLASHLRPGLVELPKGLWCHATANGSTSNALVPDSLSPLGGGACFNDARVQVEPR